MTDKQKTDLAQNASIDDKDRKDRPGATNGQPAMNADYDYRPDFGDTGGAENKEGQMLDGKPAANQKPKQEGDNPKDLKKPEEKFAADKAK
ncbi:MAG: hypothetical protein GC179_16930 [Anaerolineaceae bacterium]|nr:hypothetical protein [Anaerolineaceae bacterium]